MNSIVEADRHVGGRATEPADGVHAVRVPRLAAIGDLQPVMADRERARHRRDRRVRRGTTAHPQPQHRRRAAAVGQRHGDRVARAPAEPAGEDRPVRSAVERQLQVRGRRAAPARRQRTEREPVGHQRTRGIEVEVIDRGGGRRLRLVDGAPQSPRRVDAHACRVRTGHGERQANAVGIRSSHAVAEHEPALAAVGRHLDGRGGPAGPLQLETVACERARARRGLRELDRVAMDDDPAIVDHRILRRRRHAAGTQPHQQRIGGERGDGERSLHEGIGRHVREQRDPRRPGVGRHREVGGEGAAPGHRRPRARSPVPRDDAEQQEVGASPSGRRPACAAPVPCGRRRPPRCTRGARGERHREREYPEETCAEDGPHRSSTMRARPWNEPLSRRAK